MKVVVTGGTGYIGSVVARAFKEKGCCVLVVDRVWRGHTLKNIDCFYRGDFASAGGLAEIEAFEPDVIVHCAGTSLVGPSVDDPADYYDNNISKTIALLNKVRGFRKMPVILFSSSAAVYGNPTELPITESSPTVPISPYGNTKLMTETILTDYSRAYGLSSVCFRYFNAAGALVDLGQERGATHIIARALEALIGGNKFVLNGMDFDTRDGTCVRDYVHVWDIAEAHVLSVEYIMRNPGAEVFNLGSNNGISNAMILDHIERNIGPLDVVVAERRPGDPDRLIADSTKARTVLDWRPDHSSISQIIDSAYHWYS